MFKCINVAPEDFNDDQGLVVVVYRSKFNADKRTWDKVNNDDPIHVAVIEKYHTTTKNMATRDRILTNSTSKLSKSTKKK